MRTTAVADANPVTPQAVQEQIERIIRSKVFRNSPALQRLLNFVTAKAIEGLSDQLKEYTIGFEVFGRKDSYDPKIDTVVRVEMHRLREKLKEYYENEGLDDPILVEIRKGQYLPSFEFRQSRAASDSTPQLQTGPHGARQANQSNQVASGRWRDFVILAAVVVVGLAAVFFLGLILGARRTVTGIENRGNGASAVLASTAKADPLLRDFWLSLLGNDRSPVVAYADPVYLLDGANDLLRFTHGATANRGAPVDPRLAHEFAANPAMVGPAGPLFYEDGYTGTGDVQSVFRLTRLFTQMGYGLTVKRCREVTIDDLKDHSIVLLGSSFENSAVAQFPMTGDFVFHIPVPQRGVWKGEILNVHPHPGESASFRTERDPITQVVKADYALMTIQPGIAPGRYALVLGALDTSGVDGVTEFATSQSGIADLIKALASMGAKLEPGRPPLFQAILKVDLENGQDVLGVHLMTIHLIRPRP